MILLCYILSSSTISLSGIHFCLTVCPWIKSSYKVSSSLYTMDTYTLHIWFLENQNWSIGATTQSISHQWNYWLVGPLVLSSAATEYLSFLWYISKYKVTSIILNSSTLGRLAPLWFPNSLFYLFFSSLLWPSLLQSHSHGISIHSATIPSRCHGSFTCDAWIHLRNIHVGI